MGQFRRTNRIAIGICLENAAGEAIPIAIRLNSNRNPIKSHYDGQSLGGAGEGASGMLIDIGMLIEMLIDIGKMLHYP